MVRARLIFVLSILLIRTRRSLRYLLCATITLLAGVIENPADVHALSDVHLIGSFVRFLENKRRKESCDIGRVLAGCTVFEGIAKSAVAGAHNALQGQSKPPLRPMGVKTVQVS
jgi:hypothetical protein